IARDIFSRSKVECGAACDGGPSATTNPQSGLLGKPSESAATFQKGGVPTCRWNWLLLYWPQPTGSPALSGQTTSTTTTASATSATTPASSPACPRVIPRRFLGE